MRAFLAYGSLMSPNELERLGLGSSARVPVRLHGYRRSFTQEAAWRAGVGERRAVLTVRPSRRGWLNALLVLGYDADVAAQLDDREQGYHRMPVQRAELTAYTADPRLADCAEIALFVGRPELRNDEILPNDAYLELCVAAAASWGDEFAADFLATTFLGSGVPLSAHRSGRGCGRSS